MRSCKNNFVGCILNLVFYNTFPSIIGALFPQVCENMHNFYIMVALRYNSRYACSPATACSAQLRVNNVVAHNERETRK